MIKTRDSEKIPPTIIPKNSLNWKKTVDYLCLGRNLLKAEYSNEQVTIKLSDGRSYTLEHVSAASGVRYAKSENDDSVVFWTKGKRAAFRENDGVEYTCFVEK